MIAAVIVVVVIVLLLFGGGHGPSRHGGGAGPESPASHTGPPPGLDHGENPAVTLKPGTRKLALTTDVASSVGWLVDVVTFLALALAGLTSEDADPVRAVYLAMESIGWFVLVPLSFASLLTGLVQSLGSAWGLFRHYWVVFKLLINVAATIVLLLYMETLDHFARVAAVASASPEVPDALRSPSPLSLTQEGSVLLAAIAGVGAIG